MADPISDMINQYFMQPIAEHSGYNIVNTLVYAVIAMAAAYFLFKVFKRRFTREFILYTIPFVLLGSTMRVVTDSIDSGAMQQHRDALFGLVGKVVDSGAYNYGPLTVTPGIYIMTAAITIAAILVSAALKKPRLYPAIGLALWLPHLLLLSPLMVNWPYAAMIFVIVMVFYYLSNEIFSRYGIGSMQSRIAVFAHALDGAASFVAIEVFNRMSPECLEKGLCYFGQHVVERFFGEVIVYGTGLYLAIKVLFAIVASWVIEKESADGHEMNFIYLLIIVFGLAPGLRNVLRLIAGV
ncbi:Uncharacterised protein [uncultured archaeon]|nr:Uncharacterised protein [uncultured archaeon]